MTQISADFEEEGVGDELRDESAEICAICGSSAYFRSSIEHHWRGLNMHGDAVIIPVFIVAVTASSLAFVGLCVADLVFHRPFPFPVFSAYWPVAKLGFHRRPTVRRAFRWVFSNVYRKSVWNPLVGSIVKSRGLDRQRHLSAGNAHAAASVLVVSIVGFFVYFGHQAGASSLFDVERGCYLAAVAAALFEVGFNLPAIVLTRYLYLLTFRRGTQFGSAKNSSR